MRRNYNTLEEAAKVADELNDPILKIFPICPICKKEYSEHPTISRRDNKSNFCPICGIKEALKDFEKKLLNK